MFDKKIILLISFLLVTGSSYIIFHRKKDNNDDEVNLVDNSDNSINDVLNEDNQEESSSSFLKYLIFFIIVIIIAVIAFFAVKKFVKKKEKKEKKKKKKKKEKKKTIWDDGYFSEELEENNKNNKGNIDPNEVFNEYTKAKEELLNDEKFKQELSKIKIEALAKEIIEAMKTSYESVVNFIDIKNFHKYSKDSYLVDFYYSDADVNEEKEIEINDNNQHILYNDQDKKVRIISIFNPRFQYIVINLFVDLFAAATKFQGFNNNFPKKDGHEEGDLKKLIYIFMFMFFEQFLKHVSEKEKKIRFISSIEAAKASCEFSLKEIKKIAEGKKVDELIAGVRKPDISNISDFVKKLAEDKYCSISIFAIILDKLINQYFPESKELNEKENNK